MAENNELTPIPDFKEEKTIQQDDVHSGERFEEKEIKDEVNEEGEAQKEESTPKNDPLIRAQKPVSLDGPKDFELEATERLIEFLKKNDVFESQERVQKRKEVLIELQDIANEFIRKTAEQCNIELEIDGKPVRCKLFPFGSYRLGVCSPTSDIDCLCVCPNFVKRDHFFSILGDLLQNNKKVSGLQRIANAYVPILTMEYDTVDIDLSFASLEMNTIPDDIDLSDDSLLDNLDTKACNSINGVRTNDMLLALLPNKENFRTLLRMVRIWSKKRAIYGNVYGYLGGVNLALLSAFVCQRYPNATPATLVLMFFYELMDWDWPNPIFINTPNQGKVTLWSQETSTDAMPIITPSYPCINSTRSASKSTLHRMTEEFKLGFKITNSIISKKKKWSKLLAETNFFTQYRYYIRIEISSDTQDSFEIWEGTVESKIKRLALKLEEEENIQYAVTFPKCFEKSEDPKIKFPGSFFIGMIFSKPSDPNQKLNIDVTHVTQSFLTFLMNLPEKKAMMLVSPKCIKRSDVPLFVFPNGKKPEIKKPKQKKVPKNNST